jgi:hypothetical protein
VRVLGRLAFQVRLTADPRIPRRLYLTWLQAREVGNAKFPTLANPIQLARSDDAGRSWSRPVRLSSPARARVVTPSLAVGPAGVLYALYLDLAEDDLDYAGAHRSLGGPPYSGRFKLVLARSRDGGSHWGELVLGEVTPIQRFIVFLAPAPSLAVDGDGWVYAAFHDGRLGDPDVWLWALEPGAGPTPPVRVNDTPERDGRAQYLPKVAVAPDGRLDIVYYDRRADPDDVLNRVSIQSSYDHGRTFTPALNLASRAFDSRIGFGAKEGLPDLGSRLGLIADDRFALGVWTDTRAGTPGTQKQDLARAVVAVSKSAGDRPVGGWLLRGAGIMIGLFGLALLLSPGRERSGAAA